jgi:hypothetical protein
LANRVLGKLGVLIACAVCAVGCTTAAQPAARAGDQTVWRRVGAWSGRTSMQTESFLNQSGSLRIAWEARAEGAEGDASFRATFHSAVSGRPLATFVESKGSGRGTSIVPEDPRPMYVNVEATGTAWRFTLEEGFIAGPGAAPPR